VLTQSGWVTAGKALSVYEGRVQWDRRVATRSRRPLVGCYLTGLVEPSRVNVYLFIYCQIAPREGPRTSGDNPAIPLFPCPRECLVSLGGRHRTTLSRIP
jgi:hypothetical protein